MRKSLPATVIIATVVVLAFISTACNRKPQARRYSEMAFGSRVNPVDSMGTRIHLSWIVPEGWVEQTGGDPLSLASFLAPDPALANTGYMDPKAVDVSITRLGDSSVGISAFISLWMRQAKIPASPDLVGGVLSRAESLNVATGQMGMAVDLTGVMAGDIMRNTSIIGFILRGNDYTVFVKATGDRARLIKLKPQILAFCRTISISGEKK
jgi:hypothetical protein